MDLAALRCLLDVARERSFAAVARRYRTDPSSVSRTVAGLEARLGMRLFHRSTRRLVPTEAGERFIERVAPLLSELERSIGEAVDESSGPAGTLRLTASVTFGHERLVPLLPAFRRRHPNVRIDALFTDDNLDLVAGGIDLAVRLAPAVSGDLVTTRLATTRYRVVANPTFLRPVRPITTPADLAEVDCLRFPAHVFPPQWRFRDRVGEITEVAVDGPLTLSSAQALRDAAVAGLGAALLADWLVADSLADGRLVDLFPDHEATATTFDTAAWLVYPSRAYLPAKVRAMIDFLKEQLQPAGSDARTYTAPP